MRETCEVEGYEFISDLDGENIGAIAVEGE